MTENYVVIGDLGQKMLKQSRFADPRFAANYHGSSATFERLPPDRAKSRDFHLPTNHRRQLPERAARHEAADEQAFAFDKPTAHWFREALQRARPKVLTIEKPADQGESRVGDHNSVGRRERLEPRCEIGGGANDRLPVDAARSRQIANDDRAGGNPYSHFQRDLLGEFKRADVAGYFQGGVNCTFRVLFMRNRMTEIGKYPIANIFCDVSVKLGDRLAAEFAIGLQNVDDVFHLELLGQGR